MPLCIGQPRTTLPACDATPRPSAILPRQRSTPPPESEANTPATQTPPALTAGSSLPPHSYAPRPAGCLQRPQRHAARQLGHGGRLPLPGRRVPSPQRHRGHAARSMGRARQPAQPALAVRLRQPTYRYGMYRVRQAREPLVHSPFALGLMLCDAATCRTLLRSASVLACSCPAVAVRLTAHRYGLYDRHGWSLHVESGSTH